ncbi:MAG: GNAT family N-acetyltransferase [Pseudomonadota bacterium]
MNNLKIRPAAKRDIETIGQIAGDTDLFPPEMLDEMIAGYLNNTGKDIWFVGELDDRVVTFGFCEPERMTDGTWNLLAIGVDPALQGQGHGAEMMTYLERQLSKASQRVLIVETMGTPEFAKTREFYRKSGYTEEARIREFYEAGADKVVFWKHL